MSTERICTFPSTTLPKITLWYANYTSDVRWARGIIKLMKRDLVSKLKLNRSAFSVASLTEESDEKAYWLARTPYERLRQVEILRRINYGHRATTRLQKVLEIIDRK